MLSRYDCGLEDKHGTPTWEARARRAEDALDRITKHPDCHRLIMQIACEALRGGVERDNEAISND